jgi:ATP-dependent helicase/nuclease subunit A
VKATDEQLRAIEAPLRDVCVVAGAGSGKTGVLTQRYVKLVTDDGVRPDELVTITFTDAAAAEMRDRIVESLTGRCEPSLLREVEAGHIATIHGFCLRMLKEHALDTDVDPGARLLSDVEKSRYVVGRREEMLGAYPQLKGLVDRYRLSETFRAIFDLIDHARQLGLTPDGMRERYAPPWEVLAERLRKRAAEAALTAQIAIAERIIALQDVPSADADAAQMRDAAVHLAEGLPRDRALPRDQLQHALKEALHRWPSHQDDPLARRRRRLMDRTRASADLWRWFEPDLDPDEAFHADLCLIVDVAAHEWERFQQFKQESGHLDFTDMLLAARDLFRRFPRRFHERFRYVLVDEFQDTDPLQAEIVSLLTADPRQTGGDGGTFGVGDARQSIYRFRNADLRVFREFEQRCATSEADSRRLPLTANFRSVPPILDFVEVLFGSLWANRDAELARDPLGAARDLVEEAREGRLFPTNADTPDDPAQILAAGVAGPRVELFVYDPADIAPEAAAMAASKWTSRKGEKLLADQAAAYEAERLARRIRHLVDVERPRIFDRDTRRHRRLRYADIAVLLFARTHLGAYEVVFDAHQLPFIASGGRAYYSRLEIRDVVNALAITVNPRQDIETAALWRSPMVGLTDESLFRLSDMLIEPPRDGGRSPKRRQPLVSVLDLPDEQIRAAIGDEQADRLFRFRDTLQLLGRRRATLSCTDAVRHWIDATDIRLTLSASANAPQAIANLDKLVQIAAEFEQDGRRPIAEFVDSLVECRQAEVREADAPPAPEPGEDEIDAVRIMTVHGAKGLEFPVVCVPDLGRDFTHWGSDIDERGNWMRNPWRALRRVRRGRQGHARAGGRPGSDDDDAARTAGAGRGRSRRGEAAAVRGLHAGAGAAVSVEQRRLERPVRAARLCGQRRDVAAERDRPRRGSRWGARRSRRRRGWTRRTGGCRTTTNGSCCRAGTGWRRRWCGSGTMSRRCRFACRRWCRRSCSPTTSGPGGRCGFTRRPIRSARRRCGIAPRSRRMRLRF